MVSLFALECRADGPAPRLYERVRYVFLVHTAPPPTPLPQTTHDAGDAGFRRK